MTQSSDSIEPIVLDAKQAAAYITISLRKLDDLQAAGYLRPLRIGRNRLFPREQLHALLKRAATEKIG